MMEIDDDYIRQYMFNSAGQRKNIKKYLTPEIAGYLSERFFDSESIEESLYRIKHHIEIRPICCICGKPVIFSIRYNKFFETCDSDICINANKVRKIKQTKLTRYGDANYHNIEQAHQTMLIKYGDTNFNNREKCRQTKAERYGDENFNNTAQMMETKLSHYGNASYVNPDKARQTKFSRYGDETFNNHEQAVQTCQTIYGVDSPLSDLSVRQKITESMLINHNGQYFVNPDKAKQTKFEKYGDMNFNNREQAKETCINQFGVDNYFKTDICQVNSHSDAAIQKCNETKKLNNSFNKSDSEEICYQLLCDKFGTDNVKRQYRSDLYPFNCDFYITSNDLYIEYNGSQYHHEHPFNPDDINDIAELTKLTEKSKSLIQKTGKTKNQYTNIINTWTVRDPVKRSAAKQNNLNYLEFFNIDEITNWLKTI